MTTSRELQLLQALQARLTGTALGSTTMPTGLSVSRYRMREVAPGSLPHVSIYPVKSSIEARGNALEDFLTVKLACWVTGDALDEAMDALYCWIHQQVLGEESLGGLSIKTDLQDKTWSASLADAPFGDLDLHFLFQLRTQRRDPAAGA